MLICVSESEGIGSRESRKTPRTYKELSRQSISKAKREKQRVKNKENIQFGSGKVKKYGIKELIVYILSKFFN